MNAYQVILSNCDILIVTANYVERDGGYLTFFDDSGDEVKPVAQFASWQGWNMLAKAQPPASGGDQ